MTASGVADDEVVVERAGACLSVRAASAPAVHRIEVDLPAEAGRTAMVVDRSATAALNALDRGLLTDIHRQLSTSSGGPRHGLRLLVGGAARYGTDGSPSLAARLAEALGVEVVAPDGPLVVLRRGELFSAGPAAAWWGFAPGRPPEPAGARFPQPPWQRELPAGRLAWRSVSQHVTVTPVPAGIWVRCAGGPAAEPSDRAFAVPPAPDHLAVLVGRPGEPRPSVTGLAMVIGALPPALRQRLVLVPYGPEPAGAAPVAQQLADRLAAPVRATHGLPAYAADGSLEFVAVDDAGRLTWRPFVTQSVYHSGAEAPTPWAWWPPLADLRQAGPASFWIADGWVLDTVPGGLLARPAGAASEPQAVRRPVDPQHADIVVTAAYLAPDNVPVSVLAAIGRLARALPPAVRERLRILITERVDPPELVGLASALRLPIHRLGGGAISPVDGADRAAGGGHAEPKHAEPRQAEPRQAEPRQAEPRQAEPRQAEPRPVSVGRLHASTVPTAGGVASAPPRPGAPANSPTRPGPSPTDERRSADQPAAPPGAPLPSPTPLPPLPAGQMPVGPMPVGPMPVGPQPGGQTPAGQTPVGPMPVGPQPGGQMPGGQMPVGPMPVGPMPVGPMPVGPQPGGQMPVAQMPDAAQSAAAPVGQPPVGQPPVGQPPVGQLPAGQTPAAQILDAVRAAHAPAAGAPAAGAPPAAPPVAAGLVMMTPDRAGSGDQWWRQASTASDRQQLRASLGWRYDAASRHVTRILSERPSLRAAAAADDAVATDLAAVHVFAASDHTEQVESLRTGSVDHAHRPFLSCVVSGLRRLPTLTGLVLRGGPDDPAAAEAYRVGRDVVETGLLLAVGDPSADLPGGVEVLIWSSTARRLDGLVEGPQAAQVVFLPETAFRVLDVDRTSEPSRVLLAEIPQTWSGRADADRDTRMLDRLRTAAQARATDRAGGDDRWAGPGLAAALPGLLAADSVRGAA